jgi:fructose-bisphosphate aldolase class 1
MQIVHDLSVLPGPSVPEAELQSTKHIGKPTSANEKAPKTWQVKLSFNRAISDNQKCEFFKSEIRL